MQNNSSEVNDFFHSTAFNFGLTPVSWGMVLIGVALGLALLWLIGHLARRNRYIREREEQVYRMAQEAERARDAEMRMAEMVASQNELTGRMQTLSEIFSSRQSDMMRLVNERLESMSGRLGTSLTETTKNTQESLARLQERLAVIDQAQTNITALSGQVVELQNILSNKQTRGAFGEGRMQAIIQDGLPMGSYEFQPTLSNNCRPDCLIRMPNDSPALVIDAKFPLEAWNAIRKSETPEKAKLAEQQFRRDVELHLKAIAEKYLISGETQETAFMFVPSESVFAEIHENHEALIQKAHRLRVVIVSPSLLMLSVQVIQSVLKDSRMREQAHLIQGEVIELMADVNRLDDRVRKLAGHFSHAQKDVDQILTSTDKITRRGNRIADVDFQSDTAKTALQQGASSTTDAEPLQPRLHLKAVD